MGRARAREESRQGKESLEDGRYLDFYVVCAGIKVKLERMRVNERQNVSKKERWTNV